MVIHSICTIYVWTYSHVYKTGWKLKCLDGWSTVLFVFLKLAHISVAVLRWLSRVCTVCVYVCVKQKERERKIEKKIESARRWTTRCLEGSPASLDSWIPSLTMSTIENVVLEGHIKDLTRISFNHNVQNIPVLLHSHESFSTCVAANKA